MPSTPRDQLCAADSVFRSQFDDGVINHSCRLFRSVLHRPQAFGQTTEAGRHNPTLRLQPALRPGFILEIGDVYFRAFTRNSAALNDVVHAFSNVSCMIANTLDVFDRK